MGDGESFTEKHERLKQVPSLREYDFKIYNLLNIAAHS
jgi:hypothetical protein